MSHFFGKIEENAAKGKVALDLGCGCGWLSLELARRRLRVVGIDVAADALHIAKRYSHTQRVDVEYVCADARSPPFRKETFDIMVAWETLHHIPDLLETLKKLREYLKKKGVFVVKEYIPETAPHYVESPFRRKVFSLFKKQVRRINKAVELPAVLLIKSPNEGVSSNNLERDFKSTFDVIEEKIWSDTAANISIIAYSLFRKSKLMLLFAYPIGRFIERILINIHHNHVTFVAKHTDKWLIWMS